MKTTLILLMTILSINLSAQVIVKVDVLSNHLFECHEKNNYDSPNWERWNYVEQNYGYVVKAFEGDTVSMIMIKYAGTNCADTTQVNVYGSDERLKVKPNIYLDGKKRTYEN